MTGRTAPGRTVRRRVVVTGHVQGVFYRDTCRREAARRGVTGWVRNRDDGSVEAVFEGQEQAVADLVAWARQGPPSATVMAVEVHDERPEGLAAFSVR